MVNVWVRSGEWPPMSEEVHSLLSLALLRQRRPCRHATVYNYLELHDWITNALPAGWTAHCPSQLGNSALSSAWPLEGDRATIVEWLTLRGCLDAEDTIDGHCEPLAVYLSSHCLRLLQGGMAADLVADSAHRAAVSELAICSAQQGAELVFRHPRAPASDELVSAVWGAQFTGTYHDYVYGGQNARVRLAQLAESLSSPAAVAAAAAATMPLYVVTYIWDGDEMSDTELALSPAVESAQYSCHAIGLALDAAQRAAVVADPNGAPVPGANLELVRMPPSPRTGHPSTALSQWDIDEAEKEKERERKKKRAKKRR